MGRKPLIHEPLGVSFAEALFTIAKGAEPEPRTFPARPFLKWVGGKRSILPELLKRLPSDYKAYREPFLGGGALYFAIRPETAFLSDVNFHLILTFNAVK